MATFDSDSSLTDLSSDLSSVASMSPVPDYPSPISSQDQDTTTIVPHNNSKKRKANDSDPSVPKKRKIREPKPRTTETLHLTSASLSELYAEQNIQMEKLLKVLRKRRKIVVIAGAGISVSAGIPDFRSATGLFKSLKSDHKLKASGKQLFDASVYQTDSSTSSFHDMVRSLSGLVNAAKPTAFHEMLSTLAGEGRLQRLYTQNVDGIDVALEHLQTNVPLGMKGPWPTTVQLHGGLEKMVCSKCNNLSNFQAELFNGPEPPPCDACIEADQVRTDVAGKRSHGIGRLRPRIVLYNEHNPDEDAIGACVSSDLRSRPDAIVVVGTSMKIPGVRRIVREMCGVVRGRKDGLAVWINQDGPPLGKEFEDCWDLVVKGPCDGVARLWKESFGDWNRCSESDVERAKGRGEVSVMVDPHGGDDVGESNDGGMLTPAASPHPKSVAPIGKIHIKLRVTPPAEMQETVGSKTQELGKVRPKKGTKMATKAQKPAQKPGRKSGRPPKAGSKKLPTTDIAKAFKVSKSTPTTTSKPDKPTTFPSLQAYVPANKPAPPIFPNLKSPAKQAKLNLTQPNPHRTLPPIPSAAVVREDAIIASRRESAGSASSSPLSSPVFGTPDYTRGRSVSVGSPPGSWRQLDGVISPKSFPRGMQGLLA